MSLDIKSKIRDYRRILQIARKPGREEFVNSTKVTSLGLVIIGLIGFLVFLLFIGSCSMLGVLC